MHKLFFQTEYDADAGGHFGEFGGCYAPELLMPALQELNEAYESIKSDEAFATELMGLYQNFSGRPTPLYYAENLTKQLGGAQLFFKNEGLNHTGAHKINHCLGQILLAQKLGKKRIIAETGAGQHGLATATVAAKFGLECTIYMGEVDIARQRPNVFWMEQLGAEVHPVKFGTRTLKDAVNAALKDWLANVGDTHYIIGSCLGPHPYPSMNRDFQSIVGLEVREQLKSYGVNKPDYLVACAGGGSNAMGFFNAFLDDPEVKLVAVEAGGRDINTLGEHAARFQGGRTGVAEGYKTFFLQDPDGQIAATHSISAGLDYAGIGPQLAYLKTMGRINIAYALDKDVLNALRLLTRSEGLIPALESAHAVAHAVELAPSLSPEKTIVVNLSGRGDKDIFIVAEALGDQKWFAFLEEQVKQHKSKIKS